MSPPDLHVAPVLEPRLDRPVAPRHPGRRPHAGFVSYAALSAAVLAALTVVGPKLGLHWPWKISLAMWLGALAVRLLPGQAHLLAGLTGVAVLVQWTALRYVAYHLLLVSSAFVLRRRPVALLFLVVFGVFVIPKEMFRLFYHWLFLHDWLSPFLLAHFFLVLGYWWREEQRGLLPSIRFGDWLVLFLFPSHAMNPMNFAPSQLWRARTADERAVLETLILVAAKALAVMLLARMLPGGRLSDQSGAVLQGRSWPALWLSVGHSYLFCALTLSGTADLVVLVARVFGWPLPHPFRWALLAWNPVELWRRWAIYNRRLLLTLVYFPLGGSERRRTLNVLITFLASGLVLHSGWVGSKFWELGAGGWRDQTVYFLIQGLAVCACLWLWRFTGKDPGSDRQLRWSAPRVLATLGTQAFSAWVHILVLCPQLSWSERWHLMARCVGLGFLL
jgi:hypothetical protein